MSDSSTITCPECQSVEPASAPFCQNCGYRLRSPETVREMSFSFDQDSLPDLLGEDREPSTDPPGSASKPRPSSRPRPARQMRALKDDTAPADRSREIPHSDQSTSTLVEGVRAVAPKTVALPALEREEADHAQHASPAPSSESAPSQPTTDLPPSSSAFGPGRTLIVGGTIFACLLVLLAITYLHVLGPSEHTDAQPADTFPAPQIIEIEAGPFRRGLSDESQSFIMQLCHRMVDESGRQCERDRLLTGEFPQQTVRMPAFAIDSSPVRNLDYRQCVDAGHCSEINLDDCQVWTPRGLQIGVRMPRVLLQDNRPQLCATRQQAQTYCQWKDGKLPTHNQWEKAARGPDAYLFPWGDFWEPDLANWAEEDIMRTSVPGKLDGWGWTNPPGAYPDGQSPYALDDMAGNVAEWVRGDDELEGFVRGGSFISNPFELRTTARVARSVDARRTDIGFRCVYPR